MDWKKGHFHMFDAGIGMRTLEQDMQKGNRSQTFSKPNGMFIYSRVVSNFSVSCAAKSIYA